MPPTGTEPLSPPGQGRGQRGDPLKVTRTHLRTTERLHPDPCSGMDSQPSPSQHPAVLQSPVLEGSLLPSPIGCSIP